MSTDPASGRLRKVGPARFQQAGPIGRSAGAMMRSKLSGMVEQEARGLKLRAERAAAEH